MAKGINNEMNKKLTEQRDAEFKARAFDIYTDFIKNGEGRKAAELKLARGAVILKTALAKLDAATTISDLDAVNSYILNGK